MQFQSAILKLHEIHINLCYAPDIKGFYPEFLANPNMNSNTFNSYLSTYIERDILHIPIVRK
jgi:hypothetical protein